MTSHRKVEGETEKFSENQKKTTEHDHNKLCEETHNIHMLCKLKVGKVTAFKILSCTGKVYRLTLITILHAIPRSWWGYDYLLCA